MRYSISEKDALDFCSIQANIFESCVENDKSEIDFISKYMRSAYAKTFDDGTYWTCYEDKYAIIDEINQISRNKRKNHLSKNKLHFAGYFYRYYCYKYNVSSVDAWRQIIIDYIYDNYDVLHSLDISKACEVAKEANVPEEK